MARNQTLPAFSRTRLPANLHRSAWALDKMILKRREHMSFLAAYLGAAIFVPGITLACCLLFGRITT